MPIATQLNLDLENRIGVLARLCRDLANGGVNLMALSAPVANNRGPVRLLVTNRKLAEHVLQRAEYRYKIEEVLFVELKNRPGALAKAMEKLSRAGIDVKYTYATAYSRGKKTAAVVAVGEGDLPKAYKLLG